MGTLTTIMTLLFFSTGLTVAQSTDETIKDIRTKYKYIRDNLHTYDTTMADVRNESTEGGLLTGYYNNNNLKLMEVWLLGETGKRKIEYYFDNEQLFFVFDTYYQYNRPIYWDEKRAKENNDSETFDADKTVIKEDRYYFDNRRLIRWIKHNGQHADNKLAYYKNLEIEIPKYAKKMIEKLHK